eukprot:COSAG05_NODE_23259_length_259_cov_0.650000_1_plen_69_part_01
MRDVQQTVKRFVEDEEKQRAERQQDMVADNNTTDEVPHFGGMFSACDAWICLVSVRTCDHCLTFFCAFV